MSDDKKLVATVVVHDDAGDAHVFGPDSKEIPDWARDAIDNPKVWGEEAPAEPRSASAAVQEQGADSGDQDGAEQDAGDDSEEESSQAPGPAAKKATAKKATAF